MRDLKGQTLGRYQIIERLGRGGMADVYKAYQPQLDRYVAIKLMHEHLAEDAQFISRFQREAKSVAALRHPHIVQVFDFDTHDNMSYMVMEYIEGGKTLKEVLQETAERGQRIPPAQALEIVAKLADALDYAHKAGMVHRDIKPSNVLVANLDHPVLSDFGIARLIGQTGLTASGAMIGTPAYMSPEQGRGETADERSDIYALGIILYEMLTGHPPYDADTPYAVILKHINAPLVTPRTSVPDLPMSAERVVLKSLAKAPEERYQSAGEMKRALHEAANELADATPTSDITPTSSFQAASSTMVGTPVGEDRTLPISSGDTAATFAEPAPSPASQPARGLPIPLLIGAGLLAVLICAAIVIALLPNIIGGGNAVGESTPTDEPTSETSPDDPTTEVTAVPDEVNVEQETSPEVQDLLDQAHDHWDVGETDQALEVFEQALELDPENVDALTSTSLLYMNRADTETALEFLERAEAVAPDNGFVNYARGMFHWTQEGYYDSQAAADAFARSTEDCSDPWVCADAYYQLSYLQAWTFNDFDTALENIGTAIGLQQDPGTQAGYYDQSAHYRFEGQGDLDGAISDLESAYAIDEGSWHLNTAANFSAQTGDYARGREFYILLLDDKAGEPVYLIGTAYMDYLAGDIEAAMITVDRALTFDPDMYGAHYMKGLLLLDSGDPGNAITEFEAVTNANLDEQGYWLYDFPFLTTDWGHSPHYDLARAHYDAGDSDNALLHLDEAINQNGGWPRPYMLKGQIFQEAGDIAAAREQYLIALEVAYDDEETRAEIEQLLAELTTTP